jgi:hypothetical protein
VVIIKCIKCVMFDIQIVFRSAKCCHYGKIQLFVAVQT